MKYLEATVVNSEKVDEITDSFVQECVQKTQDISNDETCDDLPYMTSEQKIATSHVTLNMSLMDEESKIALLGESAAIQKVHREILQLTCASQGIFYAVYKVLGQITTHNYGGENIYRTLLRCKKVKKCPRN